MTRTHAQEADEDFLEIEKAAELFEVSAAQLREDCKCKHIVHVYEGASETGPCHVLLSDVRARYRELVPPYQTDAWAKRLRAGKRALGVVVAGVVTKCANDGLETVTGEEDDEPRPEPIQRRGQRARAWSLLAEGLDVSSKGERIAVVHDEGVAVFDARGRVRHEMAFAPASTTRLDSMGGGGGNACRFSPSGRQLAVWNQTRLLHLRRLADFRHERTLRLEGSPHDFQFAGEDALLSLCRSGRLTWYAAGSSRILAPELNVRCLGLGGRAFAGTPREEGEYPEHIEVHPVRGGPWRISIPEDTRIHRNARASVSPDGSHVEVNGSVYRSEGGRPAWDCHMDARQIYWSGFSGSGRVLAILDWEYELSFHDGDRRCTTQLLPLGRGVHHGNVEGYPSAMEGASRLPYRELRWVGERLWVLMRCEVGSTARVYSSDGEHLGGACFSSRGALLWTASRAFCGEVEIVLPSEATPTGPRPLEHYLERFDPREVRRVLLAP